MAKVTKENKGVVIMRCTCADEFQNKMYGKYMRVHNISGRDKKIAYCTVCSPSNKRVLRVNNPERAATMAEKKPKTIPLAV